MTQGRNIVTVFCPACGHVGEIRDRDIVEPCIQGDIRRIWVCEWSTDQKEAWITIKEGQKALGKARDRS